RRRSRSGAFARCSKPATGGTTNGKRRSLARSTPRSPKPSAWPTLPRSPRRSRSSSTSSPTWDRTSVPPGRCSVPADTQVRPEAAAVREHTMVQAIQDALDVALARDDKTLLFGEDVGGMGGVFRVSDGLQDKYGERRVFDTPLAEAGIMGFAIGLALSGMRPIAEIQFAGFLYPALDQVLSHVGRYRHRTRGRFSVPLVVRAPYGGGVHTPEQHSDS